MGGWQKDTYVNVNWLAILDGLYMHSHKHIIIYTLALPWNHMLTGLVAILEGQLHRGLINTATTAQFILDGQLHKASLAQPHLHSPSWMVSCTEPRQQPQWIQYLQSLLDEGLVNHFICLNGMKDMNI